MEVHHQAELESKQRQHQNHVELQKRQLERETLHLEDQLRQQQELKEALEKLQQRTIDITEFVEGGLKLREGDIRRRELDMLKQERHLLDEDELEVALEEKKLEEEEKRVGRLRDEAMKAKNQWREELAKLEEQRRV
jgi:hypothetical protein